MQNKTAKIINYFDFRFLSQIFFSNQIANSRVIYLMMYILFSSIAFAETLAELQTLNLNKLCFVSIVKASR